MNTDIRHFQVGETAPDYYRINYTSSMVEFWDGARWTRSVLPSLTAFLDDAFAGGGTVREVFDTNQLPEGAQRPTCPAAPAATTRSAARGATTATSGHASASTSRTAPARTEEPVAERTRHWIEAYVDHDAIAFRLICEHPDDCQETRPDERRLGCAVQPWFDDAGTDLLDFPRPGETTVGRVEVACRWRGYAEDSELTFVPPSVGEAPHVQ